MKPFKRILIANRGEIARRIGQTCREMGIQTVCLFCEEEKDLPHALEGDMGVNLGSGPLEETYLNGDRLVQIARQYQVDAVHPGYGFLSEVSTFAQALEKAGVTFIGPPVEAIEKMGDKVASKQTMEKIGVPTIPGYHGSEQRADKLLKEALKVGFPLLIKASAGGGGKGMRQVRSPDEFPAALEGAKREAKQAFGDDKVLLEKLIENPRHIEIQVMSDSHGQHFHLFDRECSIQRRYQKIIEESPSPALNTQTRKQMSEKALAITRHLGYVGAGTIEFILDSGGEFYFLEMNTRLQVEHPVTEMVTGLDLVRLQMMAAQGERLPLSQNQLHQRGHAIEVRLYAEDPYQEFLPTTGQVGVVGNLSLRGAILDSAYGKGDRVGIHFDPMLAKLTVFALDREAAIEKMQAALGEIPFLGMKSNRFYLQKILAHPAFLKGETYTHFVQTHSTDLSLRPEEQDWEDVDKALALAAYLITQKKGAKGELAEKKRVEAWDHLSGFRNA